MLHIHLDKIDRGEPYKNAKISFELLLAKFKSFEVINNDPDFYIDEYFSELINKIDLRREEIKLEIDQHFDKILNYIKLTKKVCNEMSETNKKILKDELKYFKNEIELFDKDLKMLDMDENKFDYIESKTKILINKIDFNLKELKNYFLLDQSYEFINPQIKFDATNLGHLEIIHNENILNLTDDIIKFNLSVEKKINDGLLKKYKLLAYDDIIYFNEFSQEQINKVKSKLKHLENTNVTNLDQIEHNTFVKTIENSNRNNNNNKSYFKEKKIKNYVIASPRELKTGDRYVTLLKQFNTDYAHEFLTGLGFGVVIKNGKFEEIK